MITVLSLSPAVDKIYFVDDFSAGRLYRVGDVVKSAGGKGINVARVASILGGEVTAAGFRAGETGEWLESQLLKAGVKTCFIPVEGESRTNMNIIDRKNGKETEVLEIGPRIGDPALQQFIGVLAKLMDRTKVLVCSGGVPEGLGSDIYRQVMEIARPRGIKLVLDTSNEVLVEGLKARPHVIKPNLRELERFAGKKLQNRQEILQVCRTILDMGVEMVVASMGKDGAMLVSRNRACYAPAPEIEAVNPIGSGDSMVAGLATGLDRELGEEEMFRLGMACAVANTRFMQIGYVTPELVEEYRNKIRMIEMTGEEKS